MRTPVLVLSLIAILAMSAQTVRADEPEPATLSVAGEGEATAVPDIAIIRAGVETDGPTATAALDANAARAEAIIAALKGAGIEARDIRTGRLSLNPVYESQPRNQPRQPPRIAGYRAINEVVVRVRDLAGTGRVLDRIVERGANRINGIVFTLDEARGAEDEARREAVADARRKAALYAQAAGVRLGRILSISEAGGVRPRPVPRMAVMRAEAADGVPVEPGEMTIRARVSMVWEITATE